MKTLNVSQFTTAPQQVEKSYLVHAPIEEVWKVIADHQGRTQWMPMIKHVELVQANKAGEWGEGCERHCQFGPDLLKEKIVHWDTSSSCAVSTQLPANQPTKFRSNCTFSFATFVFIPNFCRCGPPN